MNDYVSNIIEAMQNDKYYDHDDSLTVEEVLELPSFKGYRLLAGAKGIKKRCKHITILETPNGIDWLEGEELLLTAGYAFTNNEKRKETMLIDAYNKNVSAIAIKEGRYFGDISGILISQADEFEIPLIEIPYDVVYTNT
ncbi:MAG TPA: PucR family transcriptional regulator ligand-binding domain-containing protein, partial [Tissierellaceae bacterium]|nr:PucR family transcriptional regulator ligand-binding domain-containing protein [Tissierellaceae bacterium]